MFPQTATVLSNIDVVMYTDPKSLGNKALFCWLDHALMVIPTCCQTIRRAWIQSLGFYKKQCANISAMDKHYFVPYVTHNTFSNVGIPITMTLDNLLKASIRKSCKSLWWLIDTGNFIQSPPPVPQTLFSSFIDTVPTNSWCTTFLDIPSLYNPP
jgi:hypothetical protein